ncbi:MAG: ribosome biogenesis GTPase Der [Clostridia bacterium]|nr:ribosome biogenesis GTPase Der [Clostridia bacterium]MBQ8334538.1 ribosome biogenesis GTPase Der [Clostridia bacterium]MBQ8512147.1 ribosome biogenesis GTPase Der [Clostridia bacterium]
MAKPVIAIVGRPNVGKSTLFNKLIGERRAIVEDCPGITRDRIYGETEWRGRTLVVIDTGGIEPKTDNIILKKMREQAQVAIDTADVIIFMCDIRTGLLADDMDIALMLKKSGKPVVPCINKSDKIGDVAPEFYEFYELGFDIDPIAISSLHGSGSGDVLDACLDALGDFEEEDEDNDTVSVAVIGKPNAGKSSLVNRILGDERCIVSDIPGTTRDAIDTYFENDHGKYNFIDTAGIRRQSRVDDKIEKISVLRAKMAVERANVCLLMVDANEGVTEQDEKIAGIAHEAGKASIICINKWDSIDKSNDTTNDFTKKIYDSLSYMTYAPIMFISAKTGQRVDKLFEQINYVHNQTNMRVSTGMLNDVLADAVARVQPPSDKGRRLKIYYMTQTQVAPPTFVIFCNNAELFHFSYQRYLENCLRQTFGFRGTPIRLIIRQKGEGEDK